MTGLAWLLESVLLGVLLVGYWVGVPLAHPQELRLLFQIASGAVCGIGLSSCLFFLSTISFGNPWPAAAMELAALAWTAQALWRRRMPSKPPNQPEEPRPSLLSPISLALLLAVAAVVAAMRRHSLLRTSAGALPAAVLVFAFKLSLPHGTTSLVSQSLPQATHHLLDGGRYLEIIQSFARDSYLSETAGIIRSCRCSFWRLPCDSTWAAGARPRFAGSCLPDFWADTSASS